MTTGRKGGWIQTYGGTQFWPLDPMPEEVYLEDIAFALSNIPRYGGHTRLSVAQHSVMVSWYCAPEDAMWGLLHDASEAYLGDMPRPIKYGPGMTAYRRAHDRVQRAVCDRFGLDHAEPESVKTADARLLATEKRDLMRPLKGVTKTDWLHGAQLVRPLYRHIQTWRPEWAEQQFLDRYAELFKEAHG